MQLYIFKIRCGLVVKEADLKAEVAGSSPGGVKERPVAQRSDQQHRGQVADHTSCPLLGTDRMTTCRMTNVRTSERSDYHWFPCHRSPAHRLPDNPSPRHHPHSQMFGSPTLDSRTFRSQTSGRPDGLHTNVRQITGRPRKRPLGMGPVA